MGLLSPPIRVIPFLALMRVPEIEPEEIIAEFEPHFGETTHHFGPFLVQEFTDYYTREMGSKILKDFYFFRRVLSSNKFYRFKIVSNEIEDHWRDFESPEENRRVNADPGFLSVSNLILLSTKNYYHRVPLGEGIFADLTLIFRHEAFEPLEWTYPDFKTREALSFFKEVREKEKNKLL